MLERITINNFQSHKSTDLVLHEGVNSLEGNSDCGKTAILRAIRWCVDNDGRGLADVSFWALNKAGDDLKGNAESSVSITMDGGKVATRRRGKMFNGYETTVDGATETYTACKTNVPKDVSDMFNLSVVNSQRQEEGPFFLSGEWTPGARARYVNALVRLDDIDASMQACASMARENATRRKVLEEEVRAAEAFVGLTDEADALPAIMQEMDDMHSVASERASVVPDIDASLAEYDRVSVGVDGSDVDALFARIADISDNAAAVHRYEDEKRAMDASIADYAALSDVDSFARDMAELESIDRELNGLVRELDAMHAEESRSDESAFMEAEAVLSLSAESDELASVLATLMEDTGRLGNCRDILSCPSDRDYDAVACDIGEAERDRDTALAELSTMACPMCGHVGCEC